MNIWHISGNYNYHSTSSHTKLYSRAFANPNNIFIKIHLLLRGWRPFNHLWWSKPSKQLKEVLNIRKQLFS